MNVIIRKFLEKDFNAVLILWRIARERSLPEFERTKGHFLFEDLAYLRDRILAKDTVWVAVDAQDSPIGFLAMQGDLIDHLYVHPNFWRQGIGRAMLDKALLTSPAGVCLFTLQINTAAQHFYEKNGFTIIARGVSPAPENEPDLKYEYRPE